MLIWLNNKTRVFVFLGLLVGTFLAAGACIDMSNTVRSKFISLEPGMSLTQVGRTLGSPDAVVGEITTAYGQDVVVWEYEKLTGYIPTEHVIYWVYIVDGKFLKYTVKGDWQKEKELIYRTDFKIIAY